jgi:hypothetical protein
MSSILKVDQLQDSGGNALITSDGSGNITTQKLLYPAFEAYLSADQTITESVDTKVQFDTEVFDTDNCYDNTTNYRFTPNVAGKYFVYLFIRGDATNSNTLDFLFSRLYKNGSNYKESLIDVRNNYGRQATVAVNAILDMNGTTDYLEGFLRVDTQATTPKAESANKSCYFGAYRIGD